MPSDPNAKQIFCFLLVFLVLSICSNFITVIVHWWIPTASWKSLDAVCSYSLDVYAEIAPCFKLELATGLTVRTELVVTADSILPEKLLSTKPGALWKPCVSTRVVPIARLLPVVLVGAFLGWWRQSNSCVACRSSVVKLDPRMNLTQLHPHVRGTYA